MDFKCNLWVLLCIFAHLSMETKALDLSQNSGRQVCYQLNSSLISRNFYSTACRNFQSKKSRNFYTLYSMETKALDLSQNSGRQVCYSLFSTLYSIAVTKGQIINFRMTFWCLQIFQKANQFFDRFLPYLHRFFFSSFQGPCKSVQICHIIVQGHVFSKIDKPVGHVGRTFTHQVCTRRSHLGMKNSNFNTCVDENIYKHY